MRKLSGLWVILALSLVAKAAYGAPQHAYVGPKKCRLCHDKEEEGQQFSKWKAGPHAKAFATLSTPQALEIAKAKGIADPAKAAECRGCHVTGDGLAADVLGKNWKETDGVTCESCHGFGADYIEEEVMKVKDKAIAAGMVVPDEKTCKGCHNEKSPSWKEHGFDFAKYSEKIAHPKPKKG